MGYTGTLFGWAFGDPAREDDSTYVEGLQREALANARATAEASAAALASDRRAEAPTPAPDAPSLLLGGVQGGVPSEAGDPSAPDSRAPSHDQDENPTSAGESSDDASPPSRTRKPAKRKRKPRRGSSEAYRVR